jgi:hypothetical protein
MRLGSPNWNCPSGRPPEEPRRGGDLIKSMIEDNAHQPLVSERHFADLGRNAVNDLKQIAGVPDAVG